MKRLLLDQGLAPGAAAILRTQGYDVLHVVEVGLDCAEDASIMDFAQREARTCVTLDHDFHSHLALTRGDKPSVVLLRVEGLDAARQAELIRSVYDCCEIALKAGAAVSADSKSIRIRHLPLR